MVARSKVLVIAVMLLSLGANPFVLGGQKSESAKRWVIDVDGTIGAIHSKTTETDLVRIYGQKNVTHGTLDIGEGETMPATIIFADLPNQRLEVAWKDEPTRKFPARIQIQGDRSRWRTNQSITVGTSLKILEELNGGSFTLSGFGWDYSGTVTSWNQGRLEHDLKNVVLRLAPPTRNEIPSTDEESVTGDADFPSSNSTMQKINPIVYQVIWLFK